MNRSRKLPRKLHLESLESRRILAGDVTVKLAGHDLLITGDDAANIVAVSGTGVANQFVVTGLGTNIHFNNSTSSAVTVSGVSGSIVAYLSGGDDFFGVTNGSVKVDLVVDAGAGANTVLVGDVSGVATSIATGPVSIGGSLVIKAGVDGSSNNVVGIGLANVISANLSFRQLEISVGSGTVNVARDIVVNTGGGADKITIGNFAATAPVAAAAVKPLVSASIPSMPVNVGGSLVVNANAGNDTVFEAGVAVRGSEVLNLGVGNNSVTFEDAGGLATGGQATGLGVNIGVDFVINTGNGADSVDLYDVNVNGSLVVNDAGGRNMYDVSLATVGRDAVFNIIGQSNSLKLGLDSALGTIISGPRVNIHGNLIVNFGPGDDSLTISNTTVHGALIADGGDGFNTLDLSGDNNSFPTNTHFRHFHPFTIK